MKSLCVATCQFSVEPSIAHNRKRVLSQIDEAAEAGADVMHFSKCDLSDYAGRLPTPMTGPSTRMACEWFR